MRKVVVFIRNNINDNKENTFSLREYAHVYLQPIITHKCIVYHL